MEGIDWTLTEMYSYIFQFECLDHFPLISENKYGRRNKDLTKNFY